jgi:hypothetical protein
MLVVEVEVLTKEDQLILVLVVLVEGEMVVLEFGHPQVQEIMELLILVVGQEQEMELHQEMEHLVVPVSSFSVIRSVNSQSKQLVEQFLMLAVRPFIPLLHQQTLPSLILL